MIQREAPEISVVLPVRNGGPFLAEALASLWRQTFNNFEVIVINDGSTDGTARLLENCAEPRLRIITHAESYGIARSLNEGVQNARAPLIARMDADDIAAPDRFARQHAFLLRNSEVTLLGMAMKPFGVIAKANDEKLRVCPSDHDDIAYRLLWTNAFNHPTVCFRKEAFLKIGGYDESSRNEDYELWCRWVLTDRTANLAVSGVDYRLHESQYSSAAIVKDEVLAVRRAYWSARTGLAIAPDLLVAIFANGAWTDTLWDSWKAALDAMVRKPVVAGWSQRRDLARRFWKTGQSRGRKFTPDDWQLLRAISPIYAFEKRLRGS